MRTIVLYVGFLTLADSAPAQTILPRKPHNLNRIAVVCVHGGNCAAGKAMKVTGLDRCQRKRSCVSLTVTSAIH